MFTRIVDACGRAEGRSARLAGARRALRRAHLREALDAHARLVRDRRRRARRPPARAALRRAAAQAAANRSATRRSCSVATSRRSGIRTGPDSDVEELAAHATVPVVNMLTVGPPSLPGAGRPADPAARRFGRLDGLKLAYVGDGNNVARSLAILGAKVGRARLPVASPPGYELEAVADAQLTADPAEAVAGAHAVYADVWVSYGRRGDRGRAPRGAGSLPPRRRAARSRAPTARSPCTASPPTRARRSPRTVLYGSRQAIWDQAENRRHAQKALLEFLLSD